MLHDARQVTRYPFIVLLELLVHILHVDACRTNHLLVDAWDGETTLVRRILLSLLIILQDMRIDERMAESLVLR